MAQISVLDLFSDAQKIADGETVSTNTLDWHGHGDDRSRVLTLFVQATGNPTNADAGVDGVITVEMMTNNDGELPTVFASFPAKKIADFSEDGMIIACPVPAGVKRYVGLKYTALGIKDLVITAGVNFGVDEQLDPDWVKPTKA